MQAFRFQAEVLDWGIALIGRAVCAGAGRLRHHIVRAARSGQSRS